MGVQTIIHGRIVLDHNSDYDATRNFIQSLSNDDTYPWVRTEMFSIGSFDFPYMYDNPVIGFAADYKGLENHFKLFIKKFEHVLRNIPFETAKIQMETEFYGTYNFFWKSKKGFSKEYEPEEMMIETNEWYFGHGYRDRWGLLDEHLEQSHIFNINFEYPI